MCQLCNSSHALLPQASRDVESWRLVDLDLPVSASGKPRVHRCSISRNFGQPWIKSIVAYQGGDCASLSAFRAMFLLGVASSLCSKHAIDRPLCCWEVNPHFGFRLPDSAINMSQSFDLPLRLIFFWSSSFTLAYQSSGSRLRNTPPDSGAGRSKLHLSTIYLFYSIEQSTLGRADSGIRTIDVAQANNSRIGITSFAVWADLIICRCDAFPRDNRGSSLLASRQKCFLWLSTLLHSFA